MGGPPRMPWEPKLVSGRMRRFAGSMRRKPTDAERKLWGALREMDRLGFHWRRQAPIGPYVADFACLGSNLIVEVDGSQHLDSDHDEKRDAWLESRGFRILRFWNIDVLKNLEGCADAVYEALMESATRGGPPTPDPSPPGGGG